MACTGSTGCLSSFFGLLPRFGIVLPWALPTKHGWTGGSRMAWSTAQPHIALAINSVPDAVLVFDVSSAAVPLSTAASGSLPSLEEPRWLLLHQAQTQVGDEHFLSAVVTNATSRNHKGMLGQCIAAVSDGCNAPAQQCNSFPHTGQLHRVAAYQPQLAGGGLCGRCLLVEHVPAAHGGRRVGCTHWASGQGLGQVLAIRESSSVRRLSWVNVCSSSTSYCHTLHLRNMHLALPASDIVGNSNHMPAALSSCAVQPTGCLLWLGHQTGAIWQLRAVTAAEPWYGMLPWGMVRP
jgi:hypothetical protein